MVLETPELIREILINYGYWAIFFGSVVEGPIVTLLAGFLSSLGFFNIYYAYLVLFAADIVADSCAYAIGYFGRKKVLLKIFTFLEIAEEKLIGIEEFFKNHGGKSIFFSKFIVGMGAWTLISAGIGKMDLKRFYKYCILGAIFKCALYLSLGYIFGQMYVFIAQWMDSISSAIVAVILLIIVAVIVKRLLSQRASNAMKSSKKSKGKKKKK